MEEPLSNEVVIDTDSLKFFISKLKVWDYAKVSAADYQKLSFDVTSSISKKYYVDISAKYSVGAGKILFSFSVGGFLARYFM